MYEWERAMPQLEQDFARARLRAIWGRLLAFFGRRSAEMLALEAVRARVLIRGQRDLGVRPVPLAQIIGSEGRTRDFDRRFLPRSSRTKDRWKRVALAYYQRRELPAVELYRIGDAYFVRDGHHRVSAARQRGQIEIDARVIDLVTDVRLDPSFSARDLCRLEEQSDFLEWTNLAQVRCCITIEVSELGGYLDLIRDINQHRRRLSAAHGAAISRDEAAADWYDRVYLPVVRLAREYGVLCRSRATEADWFLRVARYAEAQQIELIGPALIAAAETYLTQVAARSASRRIWPR